jgi:hypothetical protein
MNDTGNICIHLVRFRGCVIMVGLILSRSNGPGFVNVYLCTRFFLWSHASCLSRETRAKGLKQQI